MDTPARGDARWKRKKKEEEGLMRFAIYSLFEIEQWIICPLTIYKPQIERVMLQKKGEIMVALYTKGSICFQLSQYGDLNILRTCLYRATVLCIIIAQWSKALILWAADSEFKSAGDIL